MKALLKIAACGLLSGVTVLCLMSLHGAAVGLTVATPTVLLYTLLAIDAGANAFGRDDESDEVAA